MKLLFISVKKNTQTRLIVIKHCCVNLFFFAYMPDNTALVTADAGDTQDNLAAGEGGGAVEADSAQRSNQLCGVSLQNHQLIQ